MTGKIEEIPLPDLLQLFHTSKKNGVLVVSNEREGRIYLRQGRVYYAVIDDNHDLGPQKSFNRIITWEQGDFELRPAGPPGVHGGAGLVHRGAADGRAAPAGRVQAHPEGAARRWRAQLHAGAADDARRCAS